MKKYRFIRVISLLLMIIMLFAACGNKNKTSTPEGSGYSSETTNTSESGNHNLPTEDQEPTYDNNDFISTPTSVYDLSVSEKVERTTHVYNMTKTADFIVKNKITEYKILLPKEPNDLETYASNELKSFFEESTGIVLEIEKETDGKSYSTGRYLSIGETTLKKNCNVSFDYAILGASGFKIVTSGKSIIMSGADKFGTLYSVYEFLHRTIGFETYSADCVVYDKNVTNLPLYDFDITDVPDIPWRQIDMATVVSYNPALMRRLRFNSASDVWAYPGGWCHNTFHVLNPSVYLEDHRNWYSRKSNGSTLYSELKGEENIPAQLCYSCEDEEMMDIIVETLKGWIEDYPDVEMLSFSQQDNQSWCQCPKCSQAKIKYSTNAAQVIKFMNRLYEKLEPWLVENERNLILSFFAYHETVDAPAKKQGDGYVAIDDSVKCLENVAVMYAPIEADYTKPLSNESNSREYENLLKWKACSSKTLLWTYSTDFKSYLAPYNTFDSIVENYRTAVKSGAFWIFDQQQKYQSNSTAFNILKYYLEAKLSWNVNLDINELIDNFFKNYFGEAEVVMKKLFNEVRARMKYIEDELHVSMYIYVPLENKDYWPKGLLLQWLDYIEKAYDSILSLYEDDEELYSKIYDRIMLEGISYRFLLIDIFGNSVYDFETLLAEKIAFKNDCAYLKVDWHNEVISLSEYMNRNW